jgi:hypothetical protein
LPERGPARRSALWRLGRSLSTAMRRSITAIASTPSYGPDRCNAHPRLGRKRVHQVTRHVRLTAGSTLTKERAPAAWRRPRDTRRRTGPSLVSKRGPLPSERGRPSGDRVDLHLLADAAKRGQAGFRP